MPRPPRCRRICEEPVNRTFGPADGQPKTTESITMTVDEYEVIRLVDLEGATHEQAARRMDISRTTVTEVYESARHKLAESLVLGKSLVVDGGHYCLCDGSAAPYCQTMCRPACQQIRTITVERKGEFTMRIAVTYDNENVFQHFGQTKLFKTYDVEDGKVVSAQLLDPQGLGHGALVGVLKNAGVDVLICGGIGPGAQNKLRAEGIQLFGGVSGKADDAVDQFLANTLAYNPDVTCNHGHHGDHGEGHNCNCH